MRALLTPDLVYADAKDDFLRLAGRIREQLLGRYIFDVIPENPNDPAAAGVRETRAWPALPTPSPATGNEAVELVVRFDIARRERGEAAQEGGQRVADALEACAGPCRRSECVLFRHAGIHPICLNSGCSYETRKRARVSAVRSAVWGRSRPANGGR